MQSVHQAHVGECTPMRWGLRSNPAWPPLALEPWPRFMIMSAQVFDSSPWIGVACRDDGRVIIDFKVENGCATYRLVGPAPIGERVDGVILEFLDGTWDWAPAEVFEFTGAVS